MQSGDSPKKSVPKAAIAFAMGRILNMSATFALAAAAGPFVWGVHSLVRTATEVGLLWARGGVELAGYRHLPGSSVEQRFSLAVSLLRSGLRLLVCLLILTTAFLFFGTKSPEYPLHLAAVIASTIALFFVVCAPSMIAAVGQTRSLFAEQLWLPVGRLVFFFALMLLSVAPILALGVSIFLAAAIVSIFSLRSLYLVFQTRSAESAKPSTKRNMTLELFSLGSNVVLSSLASRADLIIVGAVLGFQKAGVYSMVMAATSFVTVVAAATTRSFAPRLSILLDRGNVAAAVIVLHDVKRRAWALASLISLPIQLAILVLFPLADFPAGAEVMLLASLGALNFCFVSSYAMTGYFFSIRGMIGKERLVLCAYAVVFLILCTSFALAGSMIGVAFGAAVSALFAAILRDLYVGHVYRVSISITGGLPAWRSIIGAGAVFLCIPTFLFLYGNPASLELWALLIFATVSVFGAAMMLLTTRRDRLIACILLRRVRGALLP